MIALLTMFIFVIIIAILILIGIYVVYRIWKASRNPDPSPDPDPTDDKVLKEVKVDIPKSIKVVDQEFSSYITSPDFTSGTVEYVPAIIYDNNKSKYVSAAVSNCKKGCNFKIAIKYDQSYSKDIYLQFVVDKDLVINKRVEVELVVDKESNVFESSAANVTAMAEIIPFFDEVSGKRKTAIQLFSTDPWKPLKIKSGFVVKMAYQIPPPEEITPDQFNISTDTFFCR